MADNLDLPNPLALVSVGGISWRVWLVCQRADEVHDPSALLAPRRNVLQKIEVKIDCVARHY